MSDHAPLNLVSKMLANVKSKLLQSINELDQEMGQSIIFFEPLGKSTKLSEKQVESLLKDPNVRTRLEACGESTDEQDLRYSMQGFVTHVMQKTVESLGK